MKIRSFAFAIVCAAGALLAGCIFGPEKPDPLHPKCLPHITDRAKPAGEPVKLVENGELKFVVVAGPQVRYRHTVNGAWQVLKEAFVHTTGKEPVLLDAEKDRAKWEKAEAILLLGDSVAAREFGFDSDQLEDQELFISTFEKVGVKSSSSRKDVNSSLQLQLETPTQTIRGLAILGNETIKVGIEPPKGEKDARTPPNSVCFGALDFCERFLDCRYFFPGELGFYFPQIANLTVEPIAYTSKPHFNTRGNPYGFHCAMNTPEKKAKWAGLMGKDLGGPDIKQRWRLGMTMELLGKHNPSPFSLYDDFPDRRKEIFYTSPNGRYWCNRNNYWVNYFDVFHVGKGSFAELLIEGWKEYYGSGRKKARGGLQHLAGQEWINFGVTDVYMNPEDCIMDPIVKKDQLITAEDFKRANEVDGRTVMANVYGRFYQYLATRLGEELPGKKLFILAYYNCKYGPTRYKLPENFDCIVCDGSCLSFVMDPRARARTKALFESWRAAMGGRAPSMAYLYACGDPFGNGITPEYIGEATNMLGDSLGRTGIFFDGTVNWHHYYGWYAGAHQQWDPDFDAAAAFDDMADKMFGKGAEPMKRFHNKLRANCEKYLMPIQSHPGLEYPLAEVDALEKLLNEAVAAAKDDELASKRLKIFTEFWPDAFKKYREKMSKKKAAMNGIYNVARRTGENVDWSKIPAVPGSNGLKLVWDERGLFGCSDGAIHYKLYTNFDKPDQDVLPLDYDTLVPAFNLNFSKTFNQKVYKMIGLKPFGRLRLLGAGDDPNTKETAQPKEPLGDLMGKVTTISDKNGRKITLSNDKTSYTQVFGLIGGHGPSYRWLQSALGGQLDAGFFSYAAWLNCSVNGIPLADVNFGAANMKNYAEGDRRGFEYALNFDGAQAKLRLYMKPGNPVLWGELEADSSVTNATLFLNGIPSKHIRDKKDLKWPFYTRQLQTATRIVEMPEGYKHGEIVLDLKEDDTFFLAQDKNYDGTAEDRGIGPCLMYVDMSKVAKATTKIGKARRDICVDCKLKPGFGKVTFGIWEDRAHRHSNDEIYKTVPTWLK